MARITGMEDTAGSGFPDIATVAVGFGAITSAAAGTIVRTSATVIGTTASGSASGSKR